MKCKHCNNATKKLKRPNPIIKGKYIVHHYCSNCRIVYTAVGRTKDGSIVLERPIMAGDRVEGELFIPWFCRE